MAPQDDFLKTQWFCSSYFQNIPTTLQLPDINQKTQILFLGVGWWGESNDQKHLKSIKPKKTIKTNYVEEKQKIKINHECWSNAVIESTRRDAKEDTKM